MSERAQALEAALRALRNECHAIKSMSYDEIKASAGYTNLKCWMDRMDEADALLAVPPPPPVGSPTTADVFKAGFQAAQRWGVDMEHEAWEDFATSVEPTPEPCRCEIYQSCEKCRKTDPVVFGAEQPTGAPAPCVWRDVGDALFFISAPGCGTKHKHAWPYRSIVGWSHCPYCGHPLTVER